jgi:class 3 adenylate cyclase
MSSVPQTRYAESGDASIAYRVVGDGPMDLVFVPTGTSPIDLLWDEPRYARNLTRLASFSRLICLDLRGFGSSERIPLDNLPAMQAWMDDILAVMDAAGSRRAALLAISEGGLPAMLLAASHPERTRALVLVNCYAHFIRNSRHPWALPADALDRFVTRFSSATGANSLADEMLRYQAPSVASEPRVLEWFGRAMRLTATPRVMAAVFRLYAETDLTDVLEGINVPTLVLHRRNARHVRVEHGRFLAQRIRDAKYVELPGEDTLPFLGEADDLLAEIEEFLTGARHDPVVDRVLATVLFTDIVGSTEHAANVGDRHWRDLLDAHDVIVRRQLDLFRGRAVKGTGDGVFATFDGPARAIRCAGAIRDALRSLGMEIRAGLHTGEVELRDDDLGGIAVHIGARIASLGAPGEVLVSRTVRDLVAGSGLRFVDRGVHGLKGIPDQWQVYAVEG